jgi:hypothetical protein
MKRLISVSSWPSELACKTYAGSLPGSCLALGRDGYVAKPFQAQRLFEAIRQAYVSVKRMMPTPAPPSPADIVLDREEALAHVEGREPSPTLAHTSLAAQIPEACVTIEVELGRRTSVLLIPVKEVVP